MRDPVDGICGQDGYGLGELYLHLFIVIILFILLIY